MLLSALVRTRGTGWSQNKWATIHLSVPSMPSLWSRSLSSTAPSTPNSSSGARAWRLNPKASSHWSFPGKHTHSCTVTFTPHSNNTTVMCDVFSCCLCETKMYFSTTCCYRVIICTSRYNEAYTWTNPTCCVHNIIVGQLWIEQYGNVEVLNHK